MNALQTHFWAVRDYLAPVLRESKFKEHGRITPEEFVAAGDFLSYKFPTWSWSSAESSKYTRDFLPKDKQYLISKGVPCLRRVSQIEEVAWGKKAKKGGSKEEIATGKDEKMLSFAEGGDETATGGEEDWLATHLGEDDDQAEPVGEIADIPDSEPPAGADSLTPGEEDALAKQVAGASFSDTPQANADNDDDGDVGDIPDMDDEDDADLMGGGGVIEADDPTTSLATANSSATAATTGDEPTSSNLLSVRTYDCMITYDKYYQTPRMWLLGYSPEGTPLKPVQIFQDISSDYAQKTVTIEPFPHKEGQLLASVHPCKHASVMKKVIERMDRGVKEEQKKASSGKAATETKTKKKKWGLPSAMKKTSSTKQASEESPTAETPVSTSPGQGDQGEEENEGVVEGLRVDQYLLVFLKFMASIVPAIELDATQSF